MKRLLHISLAAVVVLSIGPGPRAGTECFGGQDGDYLIHGEKYIIQDEYDNADSLLFTTYNTSNQYIQQWEIVVNQFTESNCGNWQNTSVKDTAWGLTIPRGDSVKCEATHWHGGSSGEMGWRAIYWRPADGSQFRQQAVMPAYCWRASTAIRGTAKDYNWRHVITFINYDPSQTLYVSGIEALVTPTEYVIMEDIPVFDYPLGSLAVPPGQSASVEVVTAESHVGEYFYFYYQILDQTQTNIKAHGWGGRQIEKSTPVPALTTYGMVALSILVLLSGVLILRRRLRWPL